MVLGSDGGKRVPDQSIRLTVARSIFANQSDFQLIEVRDGFMPQAVGAAAHGRQHYLYAFVLQSIDNKLKCVVPFSCPT